MARRRVESRQGIAGVRVLDSDIGQGQVARGIGVLAGQVSEFAFEGLGRRRVAEATTDARNAELQRDERGNLISAPRVGSTEFPSIYSEQYNQLLQKRFLSELGAQASEKLAEYHNLHPEDPEGFRILAEAYSEEALSNVDDDAYEVAKTVINTTASQHFTRIAQARAERTWKESRGVAVDTVERVLSDIFQNAATGAPGDEAMLDQHAMLSALLEGELAFMEDALGFDATQVNAIRDQALQVAALGRIQAEARPLFDGAVEVADIDAIAAQATLAAHKELDGEMLALFGGQEAALKAIDSTIAIAGMEQKTRLHVRDRAEMNLFNNVMRDMQTAVGLSLATEEVNPAMYAFLAMDAAMFRNPQLRAKALELKTQGIALGHSMEQLFSTEGSRTLRVERAGEVAGAQVLAVADRVGVPMIVNDDGQLTTNFPTSMYQSPEGLETINHKLAQLMAALDLSGAGGDDPDDAMLHLMLMRGLAQDASSVLGLTSEDMNKALAGEPEALAKYWKVQDYVSNNLSAHNWKAADMDALSNHVDAEQLAAAISKQTGAQMTKDDFLDAPHLFEMLFKTDPAGAERAIATYAQIGMVSTGAKQFMDNVGNMLNGGTEIVSGQNVAVAMRLYGALRNKSQALNTVYGSNDPIRAGFERLWERGIRGEFAGGEGFRLSGASAVQAQQLFEGRFESDDASALSAAGLDPQAHGLAGFSNLLQERLQDDGFWGAIGRNVRSPVWGTAERNIGYGPDLVPRVAQAALAAAASGNFNERRFLNDLIDTNFESLGYGKTSMVASGWSRGLNEWLVHNPPGAVLTNAAVRLNPRPIERRFRMDLAAQFEARYPDIKVKPEQVFLTGIEEHQVPYTRTEGRTGLVRQDRTMTAQAYLIDDNGEHFPLLDEDGFNVRVNINAGMEKAMQDSLADHNEWNRAIHDVRSEGFGRWPELRQPKDISP